MTSAAAALAVALLAAQAGDAPSEEPGGCRRCDHRGVEDCDEHDPRLAELEDEVRQCSLVASCEECGGARLLDCEHCDGGPESALLEKRRHSARRWREASCDPERVLGRPMTRIETEHFEIIIDVEEIRDGSRRMDAHLFAHLAAREMERAAVLMDEHFGAKPHHYGKRSRLWYWEDAEDHEKICRSLLGGAGPASGRNLYGPHPASSQWSRERSLGNEAVPMAASAVHAGVHLLLSSMFRPDWIGDEKAGWFDVGAAHWYEMELFQRTATYCIDEANANLDYERGQWRAAMRKWLAREDGRVVPRLAARLSGTLSAEEHALSFALYDWVVHEHAAALKPMLLGFKQGQDTRDLFREHLGMNLLEAEDAWRAWVAETYPLREPKPRKEL